MVPARGINDGKANERHKRRWTLYVFLVETSGLAFIMFEDCGMGFRLMDDEGRRATEREVMQGEHS